MIEISAIIPAYNEADRIEATVRAALAIAEEVIVVDDASSDGTADLAEAAGASRVIRLERNGGKGAAMNIGCRAAQGKILLLLDGDLGESAKEAGVLLEPVRAGQADMTIAVFPRAAGKAGFGMELRLSRFGARVLGGKSLEAPLSGQRAITRELFDAIGGFAGGYGMETGLNIDALRKGFRVLEVPVNMSHRATGRDLAGFWHRGRQLVHVAITIVRKAVGR